jgi:hypothetical protein
VHFRFPIPDPPVQSLDFRGDHSLGRHTRRIAGRQRAGDLPEMLKSHSDMKPVGNRRLDDASIDENAPKPWTTIGEGRQFGTFNSADGVEAPAYQRLDVRVGIRDGADNLSTTELRFGVANPHLQMTFSILALRTNMEPRVITIAGAAFSGLVAAQSASFSPALRV